MSKILVADDDEDICTLLHTLLTDEGFQVTVTHTGADTLDVLKREGGWLLFLDLLMPQITGVEVLQQLQHAPALFDHNQVVVMSSSWRHITEVCTEHRQIVAAVLPKPFELDQVLALARQLTTVGR